MSILLNISPALVWSLLSYSYLSFYNRNAYSMHSMYTRSMYLFVFILQQLTTKWLSGVSTECLDLDFWIIVKLLILHRLLKVDLAYLQSIVAMRWAFGSQGSNVPHRLMVWMLGPHLRTLLWEIFENFGRWNLVEGSRFSNLGPRGHIMSGSFLLHSIYWSTMMWSSLPHIPPMWSELFYYAFSITMN